MKNIQWLFALMIAFYGVSIICIAGLIKYRAYMKTRIIDPKRHLKRNYDTLYLGIQSREITDKNALDLRGYSRNFYVDTLLAQRYYSFLRLNGTIVIFAGKNDEYINSKKICVLDYPLIHPVTLMENGLKPSKYILYNPLTGLVFLWMTLFGSKRKGSKTLGEEAATIVEFCKLRNVNIEIL